MGKSLTSRNPEIVSGALCFTATRLPVQNVLDYLKGSPSLEDFLEDFPSVARKFAISVIVAARDRIAPHNLSGSTDLAALQLGRMR